jgi:hypothetical protein
MSKVISGMIDIFQIVICPRQRARLTEGDFRSTADGACGSDGTEMYMRYLTGSGI